MTLHRLLSAVFAAALMLTGCSDTGTPARPPATTAVRVAPTPLAPTTEPPIPCENQNLDLMETALGAWLGSQIIPTDQPGMSYYFRVADNQFNACSELSWVALSGINVNAGRDDGNGTRLVRTLVFFSGEDLITDPAPRQFQDTALVQRIDERSLTVTHPGSAVTYRLVDGHLLGEEQLPAERRENPVLDVTRSGPPTVGAPRPFGNVNYRPWDQERPVGRPYSLLMGDEKITCDFATFNGVQLVCYSETALPWPLPADDQDTGNTANIVALNFQDPWEVRTAVGASSSVISNVEMLPDASVTRIGDIFIDTRSDVVKIHDADRAYLLGKGIAEPVEVPTFQLDTSRHPQDLLAWEG